MTWALNAPLAKCVTAVTLETFLLLVNYHLKQPNLNQIG
jgi:hypothetical protein